MFQVIIKFIAVIMLLLGTIMIYDARLLTKKFFGFGDQNEATMGIKIFGFLLAIVGGLIMFFNF